MGPGFYMESVQKGQSWPTSCPHWGTLGTAHTHTTRESLCDEFEEIRCDGVAYDREEHEPGIICVAVPILTRAGRVLGAVSVTSSTERTSLDRLETYLPRIHTAVEAIAGEAQDWRFPDAAE